LVVSASEILARFELFDESGAPFPRDRVPGQLRPDRQMSAEILVRFRVRASGQERSSVVTATPIRTVTGNGTLEVTLFRDVTERYPRTHVRAPARRTSCGPGGQS